MSPLSQATGSSSSSRTTTLEFIEVTGREDAGARKASSRRVRAHVTRLQHARSTKKFYRPHELQLWTATVSRSDTSPDSGMSRRERDLLHARNREAHQPDELDSSDTMDSDIYLDDEQSLQSQLFLGSALKDPFWTFSVDYSPLFPQVIAHYIQSLALPIAELDGPSQSGLLRTHWFPIAMASPATMYTVLLMAASHYRAECKGAGLTPTIRGKDVLMLKTLALREVNRMLASSENKLAVSDPMIAAVTKLAAFEAVFGEERVFRQHMAGLQEMIQIRRGLEEKLGPMDAFLKRLVVWVDLNAAYFTGLTRKFSSASEGLQVDTEINEPNPFAFAGTVKTIENEVNKLKQFRT